ncbi:von Willebrand factor A, partial [Streptomyces sp. NRRL S-444]
MANFAKPSAPRFSVEVYQNEFLPEGGRDVHAIVTVTSTGGATATRAAAAHGSAAVVIMVDCSGSMEYPPDKMRGAREATAAAIDTLR